MSAVSSPVQHERIDGPQLAFRPIEERDLPNLLRWLSDPGVVEFFGEPPRGLDHLGAGEARGLPGARLLPGG